MNPHVFVNKRASIRHKQRKVIARRMVGTFVDEAILISWHARYPNLGDLGSEGKVRKSHARDLVRMGKDVVREL